VSANHVVRWISTLEEVRSGGTPELLETHSSYNHPLERTHVGILEGLKGRYFGRIKGIRGQSLRSPEARN
jgi:hypothetical protein